MTGKIEDEVTQLEKTLNSLQGFAEGYATDFEFNAHLSLKLLQVARAQLISGRVGPARRRLEESMVPLKLLASHDWDLIDQGGLFGDLDDLGEELSDEEFDEELTVRSLRYFATRTDPREEYPKVFDPQETLERRIAYGFVMLGDLCDLDEDIPDDLFPNETPVHLTAYTEAVAMLEVTTLEAPQDKEMALQLAAILERLGEINQDFGTGVIVDYEEAAAVLRRLRSIYPEDDAITRKLVEILFEIAQELEGGDGPGQTVPLHRERLELLREVHQRNPSNNDDRSELICTLLEITETDLVSDDEVWLQEAKAELAELQSQDDLDVPLSSAYLDDSDEESIFDEDEWEED